jgi:hypothetical protein
MKKAVVIAVIVLIPGLVFGDLVIKEKVSSKGAMGMWQSEGTETTYLKGDKIRTDSDVKVKGMMEGMVAEPDAEDTYIIRLDKGVIWNLNPEESTYTEISIGQLGGTGAEMESTLAVKDVEIKKTGETKKIAGYKCEGILVKALIDTEAQGHMMTMNANAMFWSAKEDAKLKQLKNLWNGMMDMMDMQDDSGFGSGMKAMWEKFNEIQGVPLGMELTVDQPEGEGGEEAEEMQNAMKMMKEYMKGMGKEVEEEEEGDTHFMVLTREVTSIEEASNSDDLFEIPEGFTEKEMMMPEMPGGMHSR